MSNDLKDEQPLIPEKPDKNTSMLSVNEDFHLTPALNRKCFFIFFFLGALNNLSYEVILCYSNDLAKQFDKESFMSSFAGCLVLFGVLARFANSTLLLKIRHRTKNYIVIASFVLGVGVLVISKYFNIFIFSLIGTTLLGIGTSLGDTNDLGFMKGLPSIVASGHSSGTGLSGAVGTSFYLLLKIFDFSFYAVVCSMLLFYPFYGLCFHFAVKFKQDWNAHLKTLKEERLLTNEKPENEPEMDVLTPEYNRTDTGEEELELEVEAIEDQESQVNQNMNWKNFKQIWPKSYSYILGFFTLYLLEYIANTWITSQIVNEYSKKYNHDEKKPFFIEYGFEVALVTYRIVLFAGRSTLNLFKFKRIWLMIIFLAIFDVVYFVHSMTGTAMTMIGMYANIVLIAGFGGVIFCNIIYISLENNILKRSEKEMTLGLLTVFGDLGILMSSLIGLIIPKLLYKE
jgi:hypothetical protein